MKKKVIRLNEQDIENLVRKIIKEDSLDWTKEVSYDDEPLKNIDDPKIQRFQIGDKTTYNNHPVTIIGGDGVMSADGKTGGNFLKVQYDESGGIFEVPINAALMRSQDPNYDHYETQHGERLTRESDFSWDDVLKDQSQGRNPNKWNRLERELSTCIEPLIEKYSTDFGNDSYAVIDAIYQIMDGMFQKR
jgi:hypothetical protein